MAAFCFMVMPFGRKPTQAEPGKGPAEVDFNALWQKAFYPLLTGLGYHPIRADQETGALIINQMLERLYFSDLVLVDLTAPNGNVYYEMGIRQATCRKGCVLLAADWSKPLFDVAQMRTVRYPLPSGDVTDEAAAAIRQAIAPRVAEMRFASSPVYDLLPGYPGAVDAAKATGVRDQAQWLAAFQAELRTAHGMPPALRKARFAALHAKYACGPIVPSVALALLRLLVDTIETAEDWQKALDFIDALDPDVASEPYVREQRALALGKLQRPDEAIAELGMLIDAAGSTSEREGLLGGRYKDLWRHALAQGAASEAAYYLDRAIEHYERGMMLDLNDFFPSSNLPRLYRHRNGRGDESRAQTALQVASAACQRAIDRGTADPWVRPTLLGLQFDLPDADKAESLAETIQREGASRWKLDTTMRSLEESARQVGDASTRARLQAILQTLSTVG